MPDIDTSPEALRKWAKGARKLNSLTLGSSEWGVQLAEVLKALAAEKEAATVKPDLTVGSAAGDRSAWLAGYRACADTVQSYRAAHYDWGPKATAQDGADLATQSIKDVVNRCLARQVTVAANAGLAAEHLDPAALIRTLRASLAGAEQERDQAIAMAEAAAEFAKADGAEITAWRTRALRAEAERDAASARAEKAELLHGDTKQALQNEMVAHGRTIIRADKAEAALAARPACDPADPCAFAQDLASENRTLDGLLAEATERAKDAEARAERMRAALASIRDLTPYAANTVSADGHHETTASIARAALAEQEAGK